MSHFEKPRNANGRPPLEPLQITVKLAFKTQLAIHLLCILAYLILWNFIGIRSHDELSINDSTNKWDKVQEIRVTRDDNLLNILNVTGPRLAYLPSTEPTPYHSITLITQMTLDRLENFLLYVLPHWSTSVIIVLYLLEPQDLIRFNIVLSSHRQDRVTWVIYKTDYKDLNRLNYPINTLRNLGLTKAVSEYSLVVDADFVPSPSLSINALEVLDKLLKERNRVALIVPCFRVPENVPFPLNWFNLNDITISKLWQSNQLKLTDPNAGHGPIRFHLLSPYSTKSLSYEIPFETQFEPYYILPTFLHPVYNEEFKDQGGDKQSHAILLNALDYSFHVLRQAWLIHLPLSLITEKRWPSDRLSSPTLNQHFSNTQSQNLATYKYFENFLPGLESRFGGSGSVRLPKGMSASGLGRVNSFGRVRPGVMFGY